MKSLKLVKNLILETLFPIFCFGCGDEGSFLCKKCQKVVLWCAPSCFGCGKLVPPSKAVTAGRTCGSCRRKSPIYAFLSPFLYEETVIRDLIHACKYKRVRGIGDLFAVILAEYCQRYGILLPPHMIITPIPLYPSRERTRGFNQSAVIARRFAELMNIRYVPALVRVKKTKPQVELAFQERLKNVNGVFRISDVDAILNESILLIDDVKTSGATTEEAARVLKEAGVGRVYAMTVAH